ncbi:MAG: hypothetical protein MJ072_00905, partial [Clostridia bacterium]|nr:hypothetical protein [Clostridia bacterium]
MKKVLKLLAITVLLAVAGFSATVLSACSNAPTVTEIKVELKTEYRETAGDYYITHFNYAAYDLVSVFSDGSTGRRDLTANDVDEVDGLQLWSTGKHTVKVVVDGLETSFTCNGKLNEFNDVTLSGIDVTYTGETFRLEVDGDIPEDTDI